MQRRTRKRILVVLPWLVAIVVAAQFDESIAAWVNKGGSDTFLLSHRPLRQALRAPGIFWFTGFIPVLLLFFHNLRWRAAIFFLLASAIVIFNDVIKWVTGRTRPFKLSDNPGLHPFLLHPFRGGLSGLFDTKNLSFPSGDVALAFASAAALSILLPKWRWAFYAIAAVVAAERVLENAHWLSDTLCAAAYAIVGVWILSLVVRKWLLERPSEQRRPDVVSHG